MSDSWSFGDRLREDLFAAVPGILAAQKENGQFGDEPWICQDQNVLLALAAAWSLEGSPYYQRGELIDAIERGGKALVEVDLPQEGSLHLGADLHALDLQPVDTGLPTGARGASC